MLGAVAKLVAVGAIASQLIACSGVEFASKSESDSLIDGQGTGSTNPGDGGGLYKLPELIIENGDQYTNRELVSISLVSNFATEMYVTNDPTCLTGGVWESYEQESDWVLGQLNADAEVFAKVKFPNGAESGCVQDGILHDDIPPALTFERLPKPLQNIDSARFEFEASDEGSGLMLVACQFNLGMMSDCKSVYEVRNLREGRQSFRLFARDKAGTISDRL
ncbi:MAG: hypothetical protein AAF202_07255, partial [Pseudomonadota bacterium]